uniref:C2 domain-containing protein n=1 Tax=Panagrolaimus sp. JU765 TaxID=591449 RepID=A0AC34RDD5_9BILA
MKNKDEVHVDACRLFFEQRIVAAINAELSSKIDSIYLESTLNDQNDRHVIKEINFLTDPIGTATKWKMDMEIKKATYGRIQKVIRNDLAPNWRTRMSLVVASDDSFHWKVHGDVQYSRAYFYSGFDRKDETKFGVNSIKARCEFRTVDTADVRIIEIFSSESESLIIVIPLRKKLSSEFLKKVKADNLKTWITKIQTEAERKVGTVSCFFPDMF